MLLKSDDIKIVKDIILNRDNWNVRETKNIDKEIEGKPTFSMHLFCCLLYTLQRQEYWHGKQVFSQTHASV